MRADTDITPVSADMQVPGVPGTRSLVRTDQCMRRTFRGRSLTVTGTGQAGQAPPHKSESAAKALKMSVVHVVTFIVFWTPYTILATW